MAEPAAAPTAFTGNETPAPASRVGLGLACRVAGVVCFAVMASQIKICAQHGINVVEMAFFRNLLALIPILGVVAAMRRPALLVTHRLGLHAGRTLLGICGMLLIFTGLAYLPLNDATAIGFSMPLFATLFSVVLLGEVIGRHRIVALVAGFAGVVLVAAPSAETSFSSAALYALGGAVVSALVMITLRQMGRTENGIATAFYFTLFSAVLCATALPFVWTTPPAAAWLNLLALGICGGFAQMFTTLSLRFAPVSAVVPFDYLQLPIIAGIAWLVFSELPTMRVVAGGAVIALSGLYMLWREKRVAGRSLPAAGANQNG